MMQPEQSSEGYNFIWWLPLCIIFMLAAISRNNMIIIDYVIVMLILSGTTSPLYCIDLILSMTWSITSLLILRLRPSSSGMIFQPMRPVVVFLTLNVTSFLVSSVGEAFFTTCDIWNVTLTLFGGQPKYFNWNGTDCLCLTLTCSDAFPRFCLKLLAFFRDLLKLLILLRMGSGRTLDRRGESEGMGVLVLAAATRGDGGFVGKISGEFGGVLGEGGSLWMVTIIFKRTFTW